MQPAPATKPLASQFRDGGLDVSTDNEAHVMELHMAAVDATAEHDKKQLRLIRRAHAGM